MAPANPKRAVAAASIDDSTQDVQDMQDMQNTLDDEIAEAAPAESRYLVPGLERGLRILTQFSPRESVFSAPELSQRLGIPRTTVFRLLQTLEAMGFLERAGIGARHIEHTAARTDGHGRSPCDWPQCGRVILLRSFPRSGNPVGPGRAGSPPSRGRTGMVNTHR